MNALAPAVGLVVVGLGVAFVGVTIPVEPTASGPIGALIAPASQTFARSATVGVGSLQVLGGLALVVSGWSR